jgi:hypothetical protein
MNVTPAATLDRVKPLLVAVAAAIAMSIGTYWLLEWLARVPGWLGQAQLPLAVFLLLGGGVYLISAVRLATIGFGAAWSRTLPYVAPALVLVVTAFIWSDRRPEPPNAAASDQPVAAPPVVAPPVVAPPATPATDGNQGSVDEPYAPPVAPVAVPKHDQPQPGDPVDR